MTFAPRRAIVFSFLAFLSLGLPDGSLGVAWPGMRASFGVGLDRLGAMLAASMAGTLLSSAGAGRLIAVLGVGRLLAASAACVATSAFGLALVDAWPAALLFGFVGGLGAGAVDAGVNAHAALRFSPRAMTWLHATWGLGATAGPLLMTLALGAGLGWRGGYSILAGLLGLLGLTFAWGVRVWDANAPRDAAVPAASSPASRSDSIGLGVVLFFVYSGVEASCGQWAYTFLTEARSLEPRAAGLVVSGYWASLTLGRVFFGALTVRLAPRALLRNGILASILGGVGLALGGPVVVAVAPVVVGFALAPVFPLAMAETPSRTGTLASGRVVGYQVAASYVGAAFWPALGGLLAVRFGVPVLGFHVLGLTVLLWITNEALHRGDRDH
jgi:fucose permease